MADVARTGEYAQYCQGELTDPYPLYAQLRQSDPIHWNDRMRMWLVTRYDDVHWGLRESRLLSSSRQSLYEDLLREDNRQRTASLRAHLDQWMLNLDGEQHTRMRKLVNLAFTPRMIDRLAHLIRESAEQLVAELCELETSFDFVERFCFPLPARMICQILGMPPQHAHLLHKHSRAMADFSGAAGPALNDRVDRAVRGFEELIRYFDDLIEQRRRHPGNDLISAMLTTEDGGDRLAKDELFAMCVFLYIAGHSTTAGVLANAVYLLIQHPEQFEKLRHDPDRHAEAAVEEVLRFESPVPRAVRRATEAFRWRDRHIERDQTVTLLLGSANRDPSQFDDPERFDIERSPNKHLAFGFGKHFCLGAPLARLEAMSALRVIAARMPHIRLAGQPRWVTRHGLRALQYLPVQVNHATAT